MSITLLSPYFFQRPLDTCRAGEKSQGPPEAFSQATNVSHIPCRHHRTVPPPRPSGRRARPAPAPHPSPGSARPAPSPVRQRQAGWAGARSPHAGSHLRPGAKSPHHPPAPGPDPSLRGASPSPGAALPATCMAAGAERRRPLRCWSGAPALRP